MFGLVVQLISHWFNIIACYGQVLCSRNLKYCGVDYLFIFMYSCSCIKSVHSSVSTFPSLVLLLSPKSWIRSPGSHLILLLCPRLVLFVIHILGCGSGSYNSYPILSGRICLFGSCRRNWGVGRCVLIGLTCAFTS